MDWDRCRGRRRRTVLRPARTDPSRPGADRLGGAGGRPAAALRRRTRHRRSRRHDGERSGQQPHAAGGAVNVPSPARCRRRVRQLRTAGHEPGHAQGGLPADGAGRDARRLQGERPQHALGREQSLVGSGRSRPSELDRGSTDARVHGRRRRPQSRRGDGRRRQDGEGTVRRGGAITRVQMLPAWMDVQKDGYPLFPSDADAQKINAALRVLSRPFNTELRAAGWYTEVRL